MASELRLAVRRLAASPAFTVSAALTLALGVGATTAIYSVASAVLFRPLPYPQPDRLVAIENLAERPWGVQAMPWSYPRFEVLRERARSFESIAAFAMRPVSLTRAGTAERLDHEVVSASYFDALGARALRGRLFSPEEDLAAEPQPVAVLSHALWQRRFGGADDIVGSTIHLDDIAFTVVGVLPPSFRGMARGTQVWTPMAMAPAVYAIPLRLANPNAMWHQVLARLRPGVEHNAAAAEIAAVRADLERQHPSPAQTPLTMTVRPLLDATIDPALRRSIWILFAAVGFVLLITAANLSNLLLTRATSYRRQLAIRRALGASRAALARITLAEALVLAALGGLLGTIFAFWGIELLTSLRPERLSGLWSAYARVVDAQTVRVTAPVFLFHFGLALLTAIALALVPAAHVMRVEVADTLRAGARAHHALYRGGRLLIIVQMALATVLVTGAGVMVQSFARMNATDIGVDAGRQLTFRIDLPRSTYDDARTRTFQRELESRLAALPGVAAVTLANSLPVAGQTEMTVAAPVPDELPTGTGVHMVSRDYFRAFGIRLLEGRTFTASEYDGAAGVALINETAAREFFPDGGAVGRRLGLAISAAPEVAVVGVVADVRYDAVEQAAGPDVYLPNTLYVVGSFYAVVRTRGDERALIGPAERIVQELDPALPVFDVRTMTDRVGAALSRSRFVTLLLGGFALLALVIAGVGIYGVVGYSVGARRREIGIRMALGARHESVLRDVLLETALTGAIALVIGVPAALAANRALAGMLYGVEPHDATTVIAVVVLILFTALVASWQPAWRAGRTDPMTVLRHD